MTKHKGKLNWDTIVTFQKLSLAFLQKHEDRIDFAGLSYNRYLTEETLAYYQHVLNWKNVSRFIVLPASILKKYISYINIEQLEKNNWISLTEEEWEDIRNLKESIS